MSIKKLTFAEIELQCEREAAEWFLNKKKREEENKQLYDEVYPQIKPLLDQQRSFVLKRMEELRAQGITDFTVENIYGMNN